MNREKIISYICSCIDCEACLEVCDTYKVTQDILRTPNGRLKIAKKIFYAENINNEELTALYTCTLCSSCDQFCQKEIPISEIIHKSKMKLVELGLGPLEIHKKITKGIIEKDNSVNGNPEERLDWLLDEFRNKEDFEKKDSETLLFLGCISSFRVKESATASYMLLKKADYDFKIMEKEPCCGEYVYSSGNLELSKKIFNENFESFKKMGIKTIITTCGGCLYAFNNVYSKYVENWNIEVKHVMQVISDLHKQKKLKFKKVEKQLTYHDPCRMGRKLINMDIYEEPRELLANTCEEILDLPKNRDFSSCCGAGSGIRGVDSSISINIGKSIFNELKTEKIVTSCGLCVFNFNYANYKTQSNIKPVYITDLLLKSLENTK